MEFRIGMLISQKREFGMESLISFLVVSFKSGGVACQLVYSVCFWLVVLIEVEFRLYFFQL